jgi:hypothetical protein
MRLELRTVVYARTVRISNVPVYECGRCRRSEVFPGVKRDVGRLVARLGARPHPQSIGFDRIHEWAGVLSRTLDKSAPLKPDTVAKAAEERIDELLDLLLVASSVGDERWKTEIRGRLSQLNARYIS